MSVSSDRGRSCHPRNQKPSQYAVFFGDEAVKMINIPTVAAAYNEEMNHVDRGDQLRSYYKYEHALRRDP